MNLLIIGCGSIGRRHAKNAKVLKAEIILCDLNPLLMESLCTEIGQVPCYDNYLKAVESENIDAAVVATPSSLHVKIVTQLASRGIHILVEKPISHSLEGIDLLLSTVNQHTVTAMMGHSNRFHEGFLTLKALLDKQEIGKVFHVSSCNGWYLPDWHFHEDYQFEYAAQKSLGGGAALTNFSHSLDTFQWLFGSIDKIMGWKTTLGSLSIDVEDSAFCLLHTDQDVVITDIADFLSRFPRKDLTITGSEGHIEADFSNCLLKLWKTKDKRFIPNDPRILEIPGRIRVLEGGVQYDSTPEVITYNFEPNYRYLIEMAYFFEQVQTKKIEFDLDLRSGIQVLKLITNEHFYYI